MNSMFSGGRWRFVVMLPAVLVGLANVEVDLPPENIFHGLAHDALFAVRRVRDCAHLSMVLRQ